MGSATCYHLAQRGVNVLGLEQFQPGHSLGSSHGDTRMIRQAYFEHPNYVPLLRRAYELWDTVCQEAQRKLFHKTGVILYGPSTESGILGGVINSASQFNIPIDILDPTEAADAYEGYHPPADYYAVFEPMAGYLEVEALVQEHTRLATMSGAVIHPEEPVLKWAANGNSVYVKTVDDTYTADRLVITSGAWTYNLLSEIDLGLTLHRNRQYWFDAGFDFSKDNGKPCFGFELPYGFFYGFPVRDAYGMKVAHHTPGPLLAHPGQLNDDTFGSDLPLVQRCLQEVLPDVGRTPLKTVNCMYTMSRDSHFIVDVHPEHPQVVFAGGFSGHGFKFASVMGEILADLALEDETRHPIDFLRLR